MVPFDQSCLSRELGCQQSRDKMSRNKGGRSAVIVDLVVLVCSLNLMLKALSVSPTIVKMFDLIFF